MEAIQPSLYYNQLRSELIVPPWLPHRDKDARHRECISPPSPPQKWLDAHSMIPAALCRTTELLHWLKLEPESGRSTLLARLGV